MKEELIVKLVEMLLSGESPSEAPKSSSIKNFAIGEYCIFRTYSAGVWLGYLEEREGTEVIIKTARRLSYWKGAYTLSEVALNGVKDGSKLSDTLGIMSLTQVIEVIPCSTKSKDQLIELPCYVP